VITIKAHLIPVLLLAVSSLPALAEVKTVDANGFVVSHSIEVADSNENIYKTMVHHVSEWWNGDHSWSADAGNLYINAKLGGCFCERLPDGGGVEHLRIIYIAPNRLIKFDGSLGPLQDLGLQGRMEWRIDSQGAGSGASGEEIKTVTFTYRVHGHLDGGFESIAPAVGGVIAEQLERLGSRFK
jgi:hypothetical protein